MGDFCCLVIKWGYSLGLTTHWSYPLKTNFRGDPQILYFSHSTYLLFYLTSADSRSNTQSEAELQFATYRHRNSGPTTLGIDVLGMLSTGHPIHQRFHKRIGFRLWTSTGMTEPIFKPIDSLTSTLLGVILITVHLHIFNLSRNIQWIIII